MLIEFRFHLDWVRLICFCFCLVSMVWLMLIGFGLFGLISIDSLFIWLWYTVDSCCSHGGSCCFRVDLCWPHVALSSRPRAALCRSSIEPCQFHADLEWSHADSCRKHIELCWSFVHVCCSRGESACSHGDACWVHVTLSRPHVALCRSSIDSPLFEPSLSSLPSWSPLPFDFDWVFVNSDWFRLIWFWIVLIGFD